MARPGALAVLVAAILLAWFLLHASRLFHAKKTLCKQAVGLARDAIVCALKANTTVEEEIR